MAKIEQTMVEHFLFTLRELAMIMLAIFSAQAMLFGWAIIGYLYYYTGLSGGLIAVITTVYISYAVIMVYIIRESVHNDPRESN